jgi:hypothetical protein
LFVVFFVSFSLSSYAFGFQSWAIDAAGNVSPLSSSLPLDLDVTPPPAVDRLVVRFNSTSNSNNASSVTSFSLSFTNPAPNVPDLLGFQIYRVVFDSQFFNCSNSNPTSCSGPGFAPSWDPTLVWNFFWDVPKGSLPLSFIPRTTVSVIKFSDVLLDLPLATPVCYAVGSIDIFGNQIQRLLLVCDQADIPVTQLGCFWSNYSSSLPSTTPSTAPAVTPIIPINTYGTFNAITFNATRPFYSWSVGNISFSNSNNNIALTGPQIACLMTQLGNVSVSVTALNNAGQRKTCNLTVFVSVSAPISPVSSSSSSALPYPDSSSSAMPFVNSSSALPGPDSNSSSQAMEIGLGVGLSIGKCTVCLFRASSVTRCHSPYLLVRLRDDRRNIPLVLEGLSSVLSLICFVSFFELTYSLILSEAPTQVSVILC